MNSQPHQNYSIEPEAATSRVVNMRMRAPTPPYLWASVPTVTMWFCSCGPLSCESAKQEEEGVQSLCKLQNQLSSCALLLGVQKPSQDVWG